jgi:hypothetical protein
VIYLGGAPMLGKSTAARILACRLGYSGISTDDIGVAVGAVTKRDPRPIDYREYYIVNDVQTLIRDLNEGHERQWPAVRAVIQRHATWDHPAVIEGYALRPAYLHALAGDVDGVFVLADKGLIEERVRASAFSLGASNVELMIERYCQRSVWYNAMLAAEVSRLGLNALELSDEMGPDEVVNACLSLLCREARQRDHTGLRGRGDPGGRA